MMKRKLIIAFCFLVVMGTNLNAQDLTENSYSIEGEVIDSNQNPIVDAIVFVYKYEDSSLVKMEIEIGTTC